MLALMGSGLNGQQFTFHGYLPVKDNELKRKIQQLEKITTNLLMMVNNLAKDLRELKAKQNPE